MGGTQRALVEALMDRFLGTLAADLVAAQKKRVMEQGIAAFRFAWAGSLTPGEAHYFRVHGPATVIEHDNTQNGANHIHAVWRDLSGRLRQRRAGRPLPPPAAPLRGNLPNTMNDGSIRPTICSSCSFHAVRVRSKPANPSTGS